MPNTKSNIEEISERILNSASDTLRKNIDEKIKYFDRFVNYNNEVIKDTIEKTNQIITNANLAILSNIRSSNLTINQTITLLSSSIKQTISAINMSRNRIFDEIKHIIRFKIQHTHNTLHYMFLVLNSLTSDKGKTLKNTFNAMLNFIEFFGYGHTHKADKRFFLYHMLIKDKINTITYKINAMIANIKMSCDSSVKNINDIIMNINTRPQTVASKTLDTINDTFLSYSKNFMPQVPII